MGRLTGIDTMLLDLDGTLYVSSQVVPGTPEAVRWLRAQGLTVRFTTNTDSIPQPGSPTAWPGSASRPPRTSWSPDRDRRPAVRRRTGGAGAGRGADGVRELLASCRAGPGERATHVWSPIPSYRATYDELAADIGGGHAVAAATVLVRSGKGDRPSQAPGAEPDARSTASPTCPDCSKAECIRPAPRWGREGETPMATDNAIRSFTLDVDELGWTGQDLQRPESAVAEPDGTLWVSDGRGGVMRIDPDGGQALLAGWGGEPNGLAIDPDGNLVTANIALGRVQRMTRDGQASTVLEEVDGQRTTSANFVFYDRQGRLWLTCLTREDHWWPAVADARPDGFIVLVDGRGARIVADGIYATNEARLDAEERYLYVAETMKARILRFPVRADGSLGEREVFGPDGLGRGGFVDGFSFDAEGNLWVTTVVRNGLGVLTRDGDWHVVVEDPHEDALATFLDRLEAGTAVPDDLLACAGPRLQFPTSVCFAGQDLRTAYVGSLAMSRLPTFRAPVPGLPMRHWS